MSRMKKGLATRTVPNLKIKNANNVLKVSTSTVKGSVSGRICFVRSSTRRMDIVLSAMGDTS